MESKIFILDYIESILSNLGIGSTGANIITFVFALIILMLFIWLLKIIGSLIISRIVKSTVERTETKWDDFLFKRKFYDHIVRLAAVIMIFSASKTLFVGFGDSITRLADTIINIYLIFVCMQVFNSIMSAIIDYYETKPQARQKSIRSLIQSAKIIVIIIAVIMIISVILQKNPTDLLVALGASAAVISLVFKDTLLGFVASIQVSAQDMARPGDWIEMPSRGADGVVTEINITNVKVKNWDNSVSMIPTYAMVSESFANWRSMEESEGRRIKRTLLIDITSVKVLEESTVGQIASNPKISPDVSKLMMKLIAEGNTSNFTTNLGLYRCYVEAYLCSHPKVVENQLRVVRYLDYTDSGMILQLYAFSKDKDLADYERIIADIFENVIGITSLFSIRIFQRPASPIA